MSTSSTLRMAALWLGGGALGVLGALAVRDDRRMTGIWRQLEGLARSGGERFEPSAVESLPSPARRYFLHAIRPGTPLAAGFRWAYDGSLRTGHDAPWMDLHANQILVKGRGFVWRAKVSRGPLLLTGDDFYLDGESRMRIAAFGLVPIVDASGPDIARSASARLLIEGIAQPSALLPGPNVEIEAVDESRFRAVIRLHGYETPLTVTVDEAGRPTEISLERWGDYTPDKAFRLIPYGGTLAEEVTYAGYTIPTRIAVGWWHGTSEYSEVIRLKVSWIEYL